MKVKNIAFSGFAAMIFAGLCGVADAASVNLASRSYVDEQLATKASIEDFENLESTVGKKATQEALKEVADQVVTNTNDIAALKVGGYITETDLTTLRNTLQAAIDEKQKKGNYADATELEALRAVVGNLQAGTVDKTVVENLKTTVETISAEYAKKTDLTAAELRLQAAIEAINVPSLEGYVKSSELAKVATTGSYADLKDKPTIPSIEALATIQALADLQTALEASIAEKQEKGEYLVASDLKTLNDAVSALQSGKADTSTVEAIQESVSKLGDMYATDEDLSDAIAGVEALIEAIKVPSKTSELENDSGYITKTALGDFVTSEKLDKLRSDLETEIAKKQVAGKYADADALLAVSDSLATLKGDVYTKTQVDAKIADAISGGEIDLSGYATTSALEALQALIKGNADEITALKNAGYQTSDDVQGAITTAVADLATKSEVNAKQDKLTAGSNITIANGTISADVDLSGLATSQALTDLQTALEASIAEKQEKGEYLVASDLKTLNDDVATLKSGKADVSTVTAIQESISKLGETYATKADMTAADAALQSAIDNIDLSAYAKIADVYTKTEADAKFLIMQDANALGANLQWDENGKLNTKGIATAEGLEDLENKVASAVTESELESKGYLTAGSVATGTENGTIAVNGTDVPVKGLGSAAYTESSAYLVGPTPVIGTNFLQATCTNKRCTYSFISYDDVIDQIKADSGIGDI